MLPAIKIENLGKSYRVGRSATRVRYRTLRESLAETVAGPFRRLRHGIDRTQTEEFWALRDLDMEVLPGEVVGVIGRNGAGKSTLLKILSRITPPTRGRIELHGRVGSLLEVGTGFHPELTGRENIYLNGTILGMSHREIARKFDEIVAFAETERFLDTPVKRYSSGMYVRLAFAVAAHLEPEILLVDEVLAVGDVEFQKKCLGKMKSISHGGRTILFVSHNMSAMQHLCDKAVFIDGGSIRSAGEVGQTIETYLATMCTERLHTVDLQTAPNRIPGATPLFRSIDLEVRGESSATVPMGGSLAITLDFALHRKPQNLQVGILIEDIYGVGLINFSPTQQCPDRLLKAGRAGRITCEIPWLNLTEGEYYLSLFSLDDLGQLDRIDRAAQFQVVPADVFRTGRAPSRRHSLTYLDAEWSLADDVELVAPSVPASSMTS